MTGQSQAHGSPAPIETSVQVALRIRPVVTDKNPNRVGRRADNEVIAVVERGSTPFGSPGGEHDQPQQIAIIPLQKHFTFDHVFGTSATQEEVYMGCVKRMVDRFMEGYNVTIMAYGQTSSGKTYTMGTAASASDGASPNDGIIPRAMAQLFYEAKKPPPLYPGYRIPPLKTTFRVSFVELYNEDLIDLLAKGDYRPQVTIREDTKGTIYWTGVQEIVVTSVEEVIHLLWFGSQNRQTHSTEMNEKSSRSHAIFSITLRQEKFVPTHPPPPISPTTAETMRRAHSKSIGNGTRPGTPTTFGSNLPTPFSSGIMAPGSKLRRQSALGEAPSPSLIHGSPDDPEPEGEWVVLNSKFHFVDLAGSERLKRTSAIGDRAKEGISINAGLHALGNVISALGDPSKKSSHIPYRDSKLTRLLQDSLGGNALALMIACVSPTELNLSETINTLKYANRARNIKNSSSLNQEVNMDNPEYLRSIIQKLKLEIKMLKEANAAKMAPGSGEMTPIPAADPKSHSNRHSIASGSTVVQGMTDDSTNEDRALSPSPSRRLTHYRSRDSISTDISHGYLDSVREEDDRYSDISASGRTTIESLRFSALNGDHMSSPKHRPSLSIPNSVDFQDFVEPVIEEYEKVIAGLESHLSVTQATLDQVELMLEVRQSRLETVEIENKALIQRQEQKANESASESARLQKLQEELEQRLHGLQAQLEDTETRKTQREEYIQQLEVKLAHEKEEAEQRIRQILEEKEKEKEREREREMEKQAALQLSQSPSPVPSNAAKEQELNLLSERIFKLEAQCRQQQEETDAEAAALRSAKVAQDESSETALESDQKPEEQEMILARREEVLAEKLQAKAVLEQELEAAKARHEALLLEINSDKASHTRKDSAHAEEERHDEGMVEQLNVAIPMGLNNETTNALVKQLEIELAQVSEEMAALTEKLEQLQKDYAAALEMEEMLRLAMADLEERLKNSQETHAKNLAELERAMPRIQDLELQLKNLQESDSKNLEKLEQTLPRLQELEKQLVSAQESDAKNLEKLEETLPRLQELEQQLQIFQENEAKNLAKLEETLPRLKALEEQLQTSQESEAKNLAKLEETLPRLQELEEQLQTSQESEVMTLEKLELSLSRIQELEERSTKAEQESLRLVEDLKVKLANAESAAEEKLADEMLDLLQKMDEERGKVQSFQTQIENYLKELTAEKSRAAALEADRIALQSQWDADKVRIQALEKEIEELTAQAIQNNELITALDEMISQHAGTETTKQELEEELGQRVREHEEVLASKMALIQELELKIADLELSLQDSDDNTKDLVANVEAELVEALTLLKESQAKEQEQQKILQELMEKVSALDAAAAVSRNALTDKDVEHTKAVEVLETRIKRAEADRDDAETKLEEAERRQEAVKKEIQTLETTVAEHLAAIEVLQNKLAEVQSQSLPSSRPLSASSSMGTIASGDDPASIIQKLESEKSRYRALVRLNEKEIERLSQDLEALAADFMNAATASEDAEEEFKARIAELETLLEDRNNSKPSNSSSTTLNNLNPASNALIASLKAERDEALKSSEELSAIVAELNVQNHGLQERLLTLEREHESLKLQQIFERQAHQDEVRNLRAEKMDRNSPSPVGHLDDVQERILRHKGSYSSEHMVGNRGEDSLATPRQSWSTAASAQPPTRPARHESTLIQQAKYIKSLEEKIAELQGEGKLTPLGSAAAVGLNIHHKSSDPELSRSAIQRHSADKASPAMRSISTFNQAAPSTPPPTSPLPPPPAISTPKGSVSHLGAPPSPRPQMEVSPSSSPRMRPFRSASTGSRNLATASPNPNGPQSGRRERDSTSSNASENNGWASPTGSTMSTSMSTNNISSAAAQALQGVEVNELRGVVDTLAHQVQALKVEQTMQQGKIHRLEAALADAEERLKRALNERDAALSEKDSLAKDLERLRDELAAAKLKAERDRASLEGAIEREKKEREKAEETRARMEARMEELVSRKTMHDLGMIHRGQQDDKKPRVWNVFSKRKPGSKTLGN